MKLIIKRINYFLKKRIEKTLDIFLRFKSFRDYIHDRDKNSKLCKKTFRYVGTEEALFVNDNMINTIEEVNRDYVMDDLRPTDIVLDIGACIGGFSLKICKKVKYVYAVEPFMTDRLKENIILNGIKNITVMDYALGLGEQEIEWGGVTKKRQCLSLSEIIKLCGGRVDFLKCDCEGGEMSIKSDELDGIRRIEMEVHCSQKDFGGFLKMLDVAGFEYKSISEPSTHIHLVHARRC